MECPKCRANDNFKVIDSRVRERGDIYRRRECIKCGNRISTQEVIMNETRNFPDMKNYEKLLSLISDLEITAAKLSPKEII